MSGLLLRAATSVFLCAVLVLPSPAHALPPMEQQLLWTNPLQPVAGAPVQLLFASDAVQGYAYTFEHAEIEGDTLVLVYQLSGTVTGTDIVVEQRVFTATVPGLPAGSYPVVMRQVHESGSIDDALGALQVVSSSNARDIVPAEGYWSSQQQPGSGLFLERRGDLLSVALYSYNTHRNLQPGWWLGTGSSKADTWLVPLLEFHQGSCLGCTDYAPPSSHEPDDALRLRFESARRALVDINGSATVPVVSTPYGVDYLDTPLADSVDATWGPLSLPDLRGEWVFAIEEPDARKDSLRLRFDILEHTEDGVVFRAGEDARLTCRSASSDRRAGCGYEWTGLIFSSPPPNLFPTDPAWFALGDIEEDRMRGTVRIGEQEFHVRAFRLPVADPVSAADADAAN